MKKLLIAIVVAYIFMMGTNYLVHEILLMPDYNAIPKSHRPVEGIRERMWAMALGQAFFAALFAYIYTRGAEKKPWLAQGIRYGILMTLLTVIPQSLGEYTVYAIPHMLAVKWMIIGGIQLVLLGIIVAGICQDAAAT